MSDINPNRMIPLHIADRAVAACEKEIAELKAEVERLRKAGDAFVSLLQEEGYQVGPDIEDNGYQGLPEVVAWNAAKEGKPSV